MAGTRKHRRIIKRLETEFSSGGLYFRGISSDLSEHGLFVRTSKPFSPETMIDLTLHLPNNSLSRLKGVVRWAAKMGLVSERDGMGVEIIQSDKNFIRFLNTLLPAGEKVQCRGDGSAALPSPAEEAEPVSSPKVGPSGRTEHRGNSENDEIDSMISSMFSKRGKK